MALEPEMPATTTRVEYTCPMHPEIVRPGPGNCPICGMALEPRTVTAQEEENPELREMTRRFWISLALTVPLLAVAMGGMVPGLADATQIVGGLAAMDRAGAGNARGAVGWLAVLSARVDIHSEPLHQHVHPDRDGNRRGVFIQPGGDGFSRKPFLRLSDREWVERPPVYFEAAAAITTLVLLGQVLELRARSRTGAAIRALLDLSPKIARRA